MSKAGKVKERKGMKREDWPDGKEIIGGKRVKKSD